MPPTLDLELSDTQSILRLDPGVVRSVAEHVLGAEGIVVAELSVAIVDDATIRAVNRRHLDHDWPTDVISFPMEGPSDGRLSGEVVASAETAARHAARSGGDAIGELTLYLVHGLLHLCGHDDLDDGGRTRMRRREDEMIAGLGLAPIVRESGTATVDDPRLEAHS